MEQELSASLGERLAALRKRLDLSQPQAIRRCGQRMDDRQLRAYERDERRPPRDRLLALLIRAYGVQTPADLNTYLTAAGYANVTKGEVQEFGLQQAPPAPPPGALVPAAAEPSASGLLRVQAFRHLGRHRGFIVLCAALSAAICGVSPILESWYVLDTSGIRPFAACAIAWLTVFLAGLVACWFVRDRPTLKLSGCWALLIYVPLALLQWMIVRPLLPSSETVLATTTVFTAQAAHLKNTFYCLVTLPFWLVPFGKIVHLEHALANKADRVPRVYLRPWMLAVMWFLLLLWAGYTTFGFVVTLRPNPHLNGFLQLLVLRIVLFFIDAGVGIIWYADRLEALLPPPRETSGGNFTLGSPKLIRNVLPGR